MADGKASQSAELAQQALDVMQQFQASEDDLRRAVSNKVWGHPGGFVAEHHVTYQRLAEALVAAGWRPHPGLSDEHRVPPVERT